MAARPRRWRDEMKFQATTSQTVGPFFAIGLTRLKKVDLVGAGVSGDKITVAGRVLDGDGKPVPDALLEIWQANSHGNTRIRRTNRTNHLSRVSRVTGGLGSMRTVDSSSRR